ncbi:homeobox protein Pknox1, partial [Conidiobolus coronatus NRRL 28638]
GKKMRLNFSKHTTQILKDWLFTNLAHPFPTEQQKLNLSMLTGLSIEQINNWFINGRRRLL